MITLKLGKLKFEGKKFQQFTRDYEKAKRQASKRQSEILNTVVGRIKNHLQNDPRPETNPKYPWRGHVYGGDLYDSVFQTTKVNSAGVASAIGYGVDYGTTLEPAASVESNVFVVKGWGDSYRAMLNSKIGDYGAIPERSESLDDLEAWAYDIITRRQLGKKFYGAAARSVAKKWAKNLQREIEDLGQKGYPTIIPFMELAFSGELSGVDTFADEIISVIRGTLFKSEDVPF